MKRKKVSLAVGLLMLVIALSALTRRAPETGNLAELKIVHPLR